MTHTSIKTVLATVILVSVPTSAFAENGKVERIVEPVRQELTIKEKIEKQLGPQKVQPAKLYRGPYLTKKIHEAQKKKFRIIIAENKYGKVTLKPTKLTYSTKF